MKDFAILLQAYGRACAAHEFWSHQDKATRAETIEARQQTRDNMLRAEQAVTVFYAEKLSMQGDVKVSDWDIGIPG